MLEHDAILDEIKANLFRAQQRMQKYVNQDRRDVEFEVGELVYMKLQAYRQQSLARCHYEKLSAQFYGPFPITERNGKVAYRLKLPPTSNLYPVFHVSQLKKAIGPQPISVSIPP